MTPRTRTSRPRLLAATALAGVLVLPVGVALAGHKGDADVATASGTSLTSLTIAATTPTTVATTAAPTTVPTTEAPTTTVTEVPTTVAPEVTTTVATVPPTTTPLVTAPPAPPAPTTTAAPAPQPLPARPPVTIDAATAARTLKAIEFANQIKAVQDAQAAQAAADAAANAPAPPPAAAPEPAPAPESGDPLMTLSPGDRAFLLCVRNRESRGDYTVVNTSSGAGGAYQFMPSTWNIVVAHAGRGDLVGTRAQNASPYTQDFMAVHLLTWYGRSPWAGPGC